jgi:hypothetical protein
MGVVVTAPDRVALHPAVVGNGLQRRFRHGVDRVGRDPLGDVARVFERLVLDAGGSPEQALHPGALGRQRLPARERGRSLVDLVSKPRVGDGGLAVQALRVLRVVPTIASRGELGSVR